MTLSKHKFFVFSKKSSWRPLASKNCRVTWIFRISSRLPCFDFLSYFGKSFLILRLTDYFYILSIFLKYFSTKISLSFYFLLCECHFLPLSVQWTLVISELNLSTPWNPHAVLATKIFLDEYFEIMCDLIYFSILLKKVKFLAFGNFPGKKCDPNYFFDENRISHMRLEIYTEGKTFSKVDFFCISHHMPQAM